MHGVRVGLWTALLIAATAPSAGRAEVALQALTYFGGRAFDRAQGCAVDPDGFVYIAGNTRSDDLPVSQDAFGGDFGGDQDAFVAKLAPDLSRVLAASYLGGSGEDRGYGVAVDGAGHVIVTGITKSTDFPTTGGATHQGDADVFVAKLDPDLSALDFSTLIGGRALDWTRGSIEQDDAGVIYISGHTDSPDFPATFQEGPGGGLDGYVLALAADGSRLLWSTRVGGSQDERFYGNLARAPDGTLVAAGMSRSDDFPTTEGAFRKTLSSASDTFPSFTGDGVAVRLTSDGSSLLYATYLWGAVAPNDGLDLVAGARALVYTEVRAAHADRVPVSSGAHQKTYGSGVTDAVAARLSADGSTVEGATFLGGSGEEEGSGTDVDPLGNLLLSGNTQSSDFPVTPGAVQTRHGGQADAYVSVLAPDLSLLYSTYLGGSGVDRGRCLVRRGDGAFVVTGDTDGGMPVTPGVLDGTQNGDRDGFVAIFAPEPPAELLGGVALALVAALSAVRGRRAR